MNPGGSDQTPGQILAARLRFQANACCRLGSPLYGGLLDQAASDVESHGPTWEVLRGHESDPGPSALALRLMGAVNRLVLQGREPALRIRYQDPSRDISATWQTFRLVVERNTEMLRRLIELPVQTNEVGRCAALLPGFIAIAAETGLPLRVLEVGASAGLNLRWDCYRYYADGFSWGPVDSAVRIGFELAGEGRLQIPELLEIAERRGCDTAPVDPVSPEGRLSLLAFVWPDQRTRVERLRTALDLAAEVPVSIDREGAASWTRHVLGEPVPAMATVLCHSIVTQYLGEAELVAFQRCIEEAGERASDQAPLAWLRMEPAGEWADIRLSTWPGGRERRLARVGYHGTPVELVR